MNERASPVLVGDGAELLEMWGCDFSFDEGDVSEQSTAILSVMFLGH